MTVVGFFVFLSCWWAVVFLGVVVVARYAALKLLRACDWLRARRDFPRARIVRSSLSG